MGNRGDFRQWREQATQMGRDVQDLRRQLQSGGGQTRDLQAVDEVAKALREMSSGRLEANPLGLQELSATALEKLRKLELDLRKRTDLTSNELFLSGADEAPPKYRPLVDQYFRELSKKSGSTGTRGSVK
jgi:hypothetical protein